MLNFANKAAGFLSAAITNAQTSIVLATNYGSLFPALGSGIVAVLKIEEPSTGAYEIVLCTARSGDTLTVTRGYESSTQQAFQATAIVSLVASKYVFESVSRGRKNRLINGCFRLWDYGQTFNNPADGTLVANRWKVHTAGAVGTFAVTRLAATLGDWENDLAPRYFLRWNQTVAGAAATLELEQRIESVRQMVNGSMVVSFVAKAAAGVTVTLIAQQVFGTGGAPSGTVNITGHGTSIALTTGFARYQVLCTVPSIAGKTLGSNNDDYVRVGLTFPGTATFDIQVTDFQVERASIATEFEFRHLAEERALAQRYFWKTFDDDTAPAQSAGASGALTYLPAVAGVNTQGMHVRYPQPMRVSPTLTFYNPSAANNKWRNATDAGDSGTPATLNASARGVTVTNPQVGTDGVGETIAVHMTADAEL